MNKTTIGRNVTATLDGTKLTLEIDLSQNLGLSKSGKTTLIATTNGNVSVGDAKLGLNLYR